ncbi:MAG TPA: prepilin-type N-terminal cleavage/methylation domain-containing protein [Labilithrix sp.]|nr:prepilin-type N-terminal cleavage/methylation domain-containing protein [Labilithrix sp.]
MKTTTILRHLRERVPCGLHGLNRAKRTAARGVTLIEILIVLAIVGLIAGGVAVVAIPKYAEAQKKQAKNDVIAIHPIAEKYRVDHANQCVTVEQLRAEKELSASSKITDPWETPYAIRCADDETYVLSFGPDKKEGTPDDIRIPDTAPAGK